MHIFTEIVSKIRRINECAIPFEASLLFQQAYPLDTQTCYIDYASYAYTTRDLVYVWKREHPIQLKAGLSQSLPSFVLTEVRTANCTSVTNTGTYSCLRTIIRLKRVFSYYLLQLYVPSFMLVAVSNVSFWWARISLREFVSWRQAHGGIGGLEPPKLPTLIVIPQGFLPLGKNISHAMLLAPLKSCATSAPGSGSPQIKSWLCAWSWGCRLYLLFIIFLIITL